MIKHRSTTAPVETCEVPRARRRPRPAAEPRQVPPDTFVLPTEQEDTETEQQETERVAWFYLGRLIFSGLIELPDLSNPKSRERLEYALNELYFCVANDD